MLRIFSNNKLIPPCFEIDSTVKFTRVCDLRDPGKGLALDMITGLYITILFRRQAFLYSARISLSHAD